MFENLIEKLKKNPTTLVFTEGTDARILEAASRLKKNGILEPLLIGVPEEVQAAAKKARCYDFIMAFPNGFDTVIGEGGATLSGGERQRVSIARALAKNPKILLCDEPTGALDYKTGKQVLALLQDTCRSTGRTVIVITHNSALTAMADRVIRIKSGQAISNVVNEHPTPVEEIEW